MRRLEWAAFRKKRKLSSQMGVKGQRGEPFPGGLLFSSCPSMTLLGMRASVLETLIMPATKEGGGLELMNSFQFFRRIKPSSPWCLLCARQCAKHPSVTGMIKAYLCFQEAHGLARSMEQEIDWRKEIKVPCGEGSMANDASCCTLGLLHSLAWSRIFL